jgi:acyl-ACP thioesterase
MKPVWTDEYSIGWHDTDASGNLSPVVLCKYLMETASNHAEDSGFGYEAAMTHHQLWVIVRLKAKINKYPPWGSSIYVQTWPSGLKGLYAFRDYHILDENHDVIGEAVSSWMVINIKTRRPREVEIVKGHLHEIDTGRALGYVPDKIDLPKDQQEIFTHKVRYNDIDFHKHVNNNRYMEWAINALPVDKIRNSVIRSFQINFMSEARLNEMIRIDYSSSEEVVQGTRLSDEKPVFRVRFDLELP